MKVKMKKEEKGKEKKKKNILRNPGNKKDNFRVN
jgi:hypothetical protein